jgi:ABC-type uncharacterized transport system ATPase subunit
VPAVTDDEFRRAVEHAQTNMTPAKIERTLKKIKLEQQEKDDKNTAYRWLELSGTLAKAKQMLVAEVPAAQRVTFEADEIEELGDDIAKVRAVLELLAMAVAGSVAIDWDADLAKLTRPDEASS